MPRRGKQPVQASRLPHRLTGIGDNIPQATREMMVETVCAISARNKANREKLLMSHTAGTKLYARYRAEEGYLRSKGIIKNSKRGRSDIEDGIGTRDKFARVHDMDHSSGAEDGMSD